MPQKVLYITNAISGPGGLERVLSIKASYLVEHFNYEVHIITINQNSTDTFYKFHPNISQHDILASGNPIKYFTTYLKSIKRYIKIIKPDVISVCDDGLKGLFLPLFIRKKCPMIYERHVSKNIEIKNDNNSVFQKLLTFIKFKLMNVGGSFYDKFIVLTNGNKNEWNLNNLEVIPNPLSFFPKETEISSLESKRVITVGKHSFQKGYDRLIRSWKKVISNHPDWTLDIYGTINEHVGLEQLAIGLGVDNSINFFQPVKNIQDKYKESSIYVMSSRYEGFGMVLIEAMAYGVPCISFDCPYGPSDIIQDNKNGILVENGDINALSNQISKLITDVNLRKSLGKEARNDVEDFLPNKIVAKWHSLFQSLISTAT
ncbi:glycosyltransferase family 4 protein [Sabulilitoribacter multivorans]|uniref:Glycosyltransferase family 4 protein n=1 Tax=Flaviramulus multivorans TaxID=1304750 RepID=A0ABS9IJJ7_9FLAO|nr:glycosyltransferase family 4 protein [Flaviramulus multivorans]MCF7560774.1 glycosyltransferase family 4 protein [Flaviramulus multivorans]